MLLSGLHSGDLLTCERAWAGLGKLFGKQVDEAPQWMGSVDFPEGVDLLSPVQHTLDALQLHLKGMLKAEGDARRLSWQAYKERKHPVRILAEAAKPDLQVHLVGMESKGVYTTVPDHAATMLAESYSQFWASPGTSREEELLLEFPCVHGDAMPPHEITPEQVGEAIRAMGKNKAIGIDGIQVDALRDLPQRVHAVLACSSLVASMCGRNWAVSMNNPVSSISLI
eukprot:3266977-Amphidinium_carterae.1